MKIEPTNQSITEISADAIVVGIWNEQSLSGAAAELNRATNGALENLIESKLVSASSNTATTMLAPAGVKANVAVIVGLGKQDDFTPAIAYQAAGAASRTLSDLPREKVAFFLDVDHMDHAIAGSMIGCVGQDIYRQEKKTNPIQTVAWATDDLKLIDEAQIVGQSINLTRRMVNLPASDIFPESFAEQCVATGKESGFEVEVWDEERLKKERCGALLAVAQGSAMKPRLVMMRYNGGPSDQQPLGLVGKGVTFDSGGLSLKPSAGMIDMKCDMAGAATVLGAMQAIAKLKLPVNVIGFAGLVENMISGTCYRLGDVVTARSGKTIEIRNTDAEGRLVLADTIDVAIEQGVGKLIDLATLTGACMVALGPNIVGLMTNDQSWADAVSKASETVGEKTWQLPMHDEFTEQIKSKIADIKNTGEGRWGGAMTAGKLLEEFVQDKPWVHLDIAGPSFADSPKPWIDAGASGCMVRTLIEVARQHS
ncbi:leucyl aminopeptidase [Mariniblastus sp.]|nr:leucyl aminopeptidase [Mariniblastus sp.]